MQKVTRFEPKLTEVNQNITRLNQIYQSKTKCNRLNQKLLNLTKKKNDKTNPKPTKYNQKSDRNNPKVNKAKQECDKSDPRLTKVKRNVTDKTKVTKLNQNM